MRPIKQAAVAAIAMICLSVIPGLWADARLNPYQTIVDRNPFGIKPPPPPVEDVTPPQAIPPAKVILTGVLNLLGPPRALLEITETEPGKAPTTAKRTLQAGEAEGQVEVLSIDVEHATVRIRNGKIETNLVFEVAKATTAPAGPGIPGAFPAPPALIPPAPAAPGAANPLTFSPNNMNSARGGAGISTWGATPATPAAVAPNPIPTPNPFPVYNPNPNLSTIGAPTTTTPANSALGANPANTSIPYRQPRAFPPTK
jgi:hypothetical protein